MHNKQILTTEHSVFFNRRIVHLDNVKIPFFLPTYAPFIEHIKC